VRFPRATQLSPTRSPARRGPRDECDPGWMGFGRFRHPQTAPPAASTRASARLPERMESASGGPVARLRTRRGLAGVPAVGAAARQVQARGCAEGLWLVTFTGASRTRSSFSRAWTTTVKRRGASCRFGKRGRRRGGSRSADPGWCPLPGLLPPTTGIGCRGRGCDGLSLPGRSAAAQARSATSGSRE
jgi:hypothetical protein